MLLNPLVNVIEAHQQVLVLLLRRGLGPVDLLRGASNVSNLSLDLDLVLLNPYNTFSLSLEENINLL